MHANTPRDAIARLETLVMMAGMELPLMAIRSQIVSAVNVIVQTSRLSDGSRKVTSITEITGLEGDKPTMQEVFAFQQTGIDKTDKTTKNKVLGKYVCVNVPTFLKELDAKGIPFSMEWFG